MDVQRSDAGDAGAPRRRSARPPQPADTGLAEKAVDDELDGPPTPDRRRSTGKTRRAIPGSKTQVTAYLSAAVANDARNAVLALMANPGGHRTLSALIESAIAREVQRLSDELYGGKPFPQRQVELPDGRPVGG